MELESALELTKLYEMPQIRSIVVKKLNDKISCPFRKIEFALKHDIKDWIKPCVMDLVERDQRLTFEEALKLGQPISFIVASLRERVNLWGYQYRVHTEPLSRLDEELDHIVRECQQDW